LWFLSVPVHPLLLAYPKLVRSTHHGNAEEQLHPNAGSSLNEVRTA